MNRFYVILAMICLVLLCALLLLVARQQTAIDDLYSGLARLEKQPASNYFADDSGGVESLERQLSLLRLQVDRLEMRLLEKEAVERSRNTAPPVADPEFEARAATEPPTTTSAPKTAPTEKLEPAKSAATASGKEKAGGWFVNLGAFNNAEAARRWIAQFSDTRYPLESIIVDTHGTSVYRVRMKGFASYAEARQWSEKLIAERGLDSVWVSGE